MFSFIFFYFMSLYMVSFFFFFSTSSLLNAYCVLRVKMTNDNVTTTRGEERPGRET